MYSKQQLQFKMVFGISYFVTKIVLTYCEKELFYLVMERERLLKFKVEGQEFAKSLRFLKQFIRTVKVRTIFKTATKHQSKYCSDLSLFE